MTKKFNERFDIEVPIEEAKRRFINRVHNSLLGQEGLAGYDWPVTGRAVANALGELYAGGQLYHASTFELYTRKEFHRTLQAIEALYGISSVFAQRVDGLVAEILSLCEIDLGIRWTKGRFLPSGAKILDDKLVNEVLNWLRVGTYQTVLTPFEKGLDHLLRSQAKPELLTDVVTDVYESLEALAKIVCSNEKTLDANREMFISRVSASNEYKQILRDYCEYAHRFRHGASAPENKPTITHAETESFVYLTGLFIRLVISAGFSLAPAN
jgi:hypothetical protein